jgi:site-specific recombinase XerC
MRLLLRYAAERTAVTPSALDFADLEAPLIAGFLDHLQTERGNSVRTRNARLAAIHSLFRFAALAHPEHAESIARVLAIPQKRFDRALITYLSEDEVDALLTARDMTTWTGRRDHALLLLAVQTGLRISELTGLTRADLHLGPGAHIAGHGKGRKDRITPLSGGQLWEGDADPAVRIVIDAEFVVAAGAHSAERGVPAATVRNNRGRVNPRRSQPGCEPPVVGLNCVGRAAGGDMLHRADRVFDPAGIYRRGVGGDLDWRAWAGWRATLA